MDEAGADALREQLTPELLERVEARFEARIEERISIGPLPPPEALVEYERVLPGLADRIASMAEEQSRHRQRLEDRVTKHNVSAESRSQAWAGTIALVAIVGSIYLISVGKQVTGLMGILGTLVSLVTVFISAQTKRDRELAGKSSKNP